MKKHLLSATPLLLLAGAAQAHPGHGAQLPWHWHASDLVGIAVVAVLAAIALWFLRGDR